MGTIPAPAACALALLVYARVMDAQQVRGWLREEGTAAPIPAAVVTLLDTAGVSRNQTTTDSLGFFNMRVAAAGMYRLAVDRIGYAAVRTGVLELTTDKTTAFEIHVAPSAVRLEPVVVLDRPASRLDRFYEHRRRFEKLGIGDFLGGEELEMWINQPVSAVLQSIPYLNSAGANMGRLGSRSRRCQVAYYIDGVRLRTLFGQSVDDMLRVVDLEGIEMYRGQSQLPAEYSDAQSRGCPVVAFWTRRTR